MGCSISPRVSHLCRKHRFANYERTALCPLGRCRRQHQCFSRPLLHPRSRLSPRLSFPRFVRLPSLHPPSRRVRNRHSPALASSRMTGTTTTPCPASTPFLPLRQRTLRRNCLKPTCSSIARILQPLRCWRNRCWHTMPGRSMPCCCSVWLPSGSSRTSRRLAGSSRPFIPVTNAGRHIIIWPTFTVTVEIARMLNWPAVPTVS